MQASWEPSSNCWAGGMAACTSWYTQSKWALLLNDWRNLHNLVWFRYLMWLTLFFSLSLTYRYALNSVQKGQFEVQNLIKIINNHKNTMHCFQTFSLFCENYSKLIPLNFILAFYVAQVVSRWWSQWNVSERYWDLLYFKSVLLLGNTMARWGGFWDECVLSRQWQLQQTYQKNCGQVWVW